MSQKYFRRAPQTGNIRSWVGAEGAALVPDAMRAKRVALVNWAMENFMMVVKFEGSGYPLL